MANRHMQIFCPIVFSMHLELVLEDKESSGKILEPDDFLLMADHTNGIVSRLLICLVSILWVIFFPAELVCQKILFPKNMSRFDVYFNLDCSIQKILCPVTHL